jgi:nucleoside-diphosphate-sugar epimerase
VRPLSRPGFELGGTPSPGDLDGVQALVHCAWDFSARTREEIERTNVEGSNRLLDVAAAAGVSRLIFLSTLSAFDGAQSMYGRAKLAVESHALELGGAVVRSGLVWGDEPGSLYGTLRGIALRTPVLPVPSNRNTQLYLTHEDDLGALVAHLAAAPMVPSRPIVAAAQEPLSLGEILRAASAAEGHAVRAVRIPWRLPWAGLRMLELAGLRPPFRSDSLVSLVSLEQQPFRIAEPPPVPFRPFEP